ncbi:MAG: DUF975 family protein [Lachnospiraceae bacterium]|nr:DUF975 family protein [Lachnospiraceae bacterium]
MRKPRELKMMARQRITRNFGTLVGATAIYGGIYGFVIIAIVLSYTLNLITKGVFTSYASVEMFMESTRNSFSFYLITEGVLVLVSALMSTLSVAIYYMCLKSVRGQETKLSDILYVVRHNPDKVILIYLIQELILFLASTPANLMSYFVDIDANITYQIIFFAFTIFSYVADIIVIALFSMAMFVYIDDPEKGVIQCIEISMHAMKNKITSYMWLIISFIPLYILASLSFFVLYLFVFPYMHATVALYYMQLNGELGSTIDVTIE